MEQRQIAILEHADRETVKYLTKQMQKQRKKEKKEQIVQELESEGLNPHKFQHLKKLKTKYIPNTCLVHT